MNLREIYVSYFGERARHDPYVLVLLSVLPRPVGIMPISYAWRYHKWNSNRVDLKEDQRRRIEWIKALCDAG